MCKPIFCTGKGNVLGIRFCVDKVITDIESKVVYEGALINKRRFIAERGSQEKKGGRVTQKYQN